MALAMKTPFKSYDRLKQSGMSEAQARSVVEAIEESEEFSFKNLATKSDVLLTKSELQKEMSEMKTELQKEMSEMKTELQKEMSEMKVELKTEMAEIKTDIKGLKSNLSYLQTLFVSGFFVMITGMVLSYFHH